MCVFVEGRMMTAQASTFFHFPRHFDDVSFEWLSFFYTFFVSFLFFLHNEIMKTCSDSHCMPDTPNVCIAGAKIEMTSESTIAKNGNWTHTHSPVVVCLSSGSTLFALSLCYYGCTTRDCKLQLEKITKTASTDGRFVWRHVAQVAPMWEYDENLLSSRLQKLQLSSHIRD